MPELPEVETVRRDLAKVLAGKKISAVEVRHAKTIRGQAGKDVADARLAEKNKKMADKKHFQDVVDAINKTAKDDKEAIHNSPEATGARETLEGHEDTARVNEQRHAANIQAAISSGNADEVSTLNASRKSELLTEKANIESAKSEVEKNNEKERKVDIDAALKPEFVAAADAVQKLNEEIKELEDNSKTAAAIKAEENRRVGKERESAQTIAGKVKYGIVRTPGQREHVAAEVRSKFKATTGSASLKQTLEQIAKDTEAAGTPATPVQRAAAPPTP